MKNTSDLPPGFRFHPTDEELIMYYLRNQASSRPCPASIIPEIDIYKFDPWELPEKAEFGKNEWYFFSPRERKYPNGVRPNRATGSGYWKATGTDKAIYSGSKYVGVKKALVFYKGRPPKGVKTEWIMHEYRLSGTPPPPPPPPNRRQNGSMRLDDWVLCRIYVKRAMGRALERNRIDDLHNQMATVTPTNDANDHQQLLKIPPTFSIPHLMELDYGSISQLLSDNNSCFDFQNTTNHIGVDHYGLPKVQLGGLMTYQSADLVPKIEVNQSTLSNQSIFGDSGYGFQ